MKMPPYDPTMRAAVPTTMAVPTMAIAMPAVMAVVMIGTGFGAGRSHRGRRQQSHSCQYLEYLHRMSSLSRGSGKRVIHETKCGVAEHDGRLAFILR